MKEPLFAVMRMRSLQMVIALVTCSFALLAAGQITHPSEVRALRAVLRSIKDPRKSLRSWKKGDPCESEWKGVICEQQDDGYSHVTELRLLKMNLSGTLAPELGQLSYATILDFMWNSISGSIPKEIGNMNLLKLLLLSGNQISGPLPDELGYLPNITKFQLDLNYISGPLPKSFANLTNVKHFHMNNNSISGQIPPELSTLPQLVHFLLDNNNLSGYLPPELAEMRNLKILQLDNNNFDGTEIPDSYANMSKLLKLSLRNCKLQGPVPDFSSIPRLLYLDLSDNQLTGSIPENTLSRNITTIDLSNNMLNGSIPSSFSGLPLLQKLSLENNFLIGDVPSAIWQNMTFTANATLTLDFQNNSLSNIAGTLNPPSNVMIKLQGNPVCRRAGELSTGKFCGPATPDTEDPGSSNYSTMPCPPQSCPASDDFEYVPASPVPCFCALPFGIGLRLRSPSITNFRPYIDDFVAYITSNFELSPHQLSIDSFIWQKGPRLRLFLKIFPPYTNTSNKFNESEIQRLRDYIATFELPGDDTFGPYDLLNFTFFGSYKEFDLEPLKSSGFSKGALLGIVIGAVSGGVAIVLVIAVLYRKTHARHQNETSKKHKFSTIPFRTGNIKEFDFKELELATENFSITTQIGQGGYGKVYRGTLADGTVVAIKRAQQLSLHGQKEFFTEIEFLSRLHHRNLVSLVGYCHEEGEQMLVYEFMPNGSLHDILSGRFKKTLNLAMRLHIAMGSAKGILYLHTEADPPLIHRDIKATNILLDIKFNAKVSDFGISRLAPVQDIIGASSQVSTAVKGTPGYVDPEYFLSHKLTHKSDVYSLGIVFLELLTGMQPISHGRNIVREVCTACQSGMMFSIIDRNMGPYPSECIKKFMALALKCCEDETDSRPSMMEVVRELENISSMLPESDTIPSESDTNASSTADLGPPSLHSRGSTAYTTNDFLGSELVSGVIPTIRPR